MVWTWLYMAWATNKSPAVDGVHQICNNKYALEKYNAIDCIGVEYWYSSIAKGGGGGSADRVTHVGGTIGISCIPPFFQPPM